MGLGEPELLGLAVGFSSLKRGRFGPRVGPRASHRHGSSFALQDHREAYSRGGSAVR
jgi:hypothetical protein